MNHANCSGCSGSSRMLAWFLNAIPYMVGMVLATAIPCMVGTIPVWVALPYRVWLAWGMLPAGSVPIGGSIEIWYNRRIKKIGCLWCAPKFFNIFIINSAIGIFQSLLHSHSEVISHKKYYGWWGISNSP